MEIEMKYRIPDKETADEIWGDNCFKSLGEVSSINSKLMKAVYYDTDDMILRKNDVAYRLRLEGDRVIATIKWGGTSENGKYAREELNVPVSGETCFMKPSLKVFEQDPKGHEFMELVDGKELKSVVETNFLRRSLRLDTGDMICEVSIDTGQIITDKGTEPICEMEVELFSGRQDAIEAVGDRVAKRYGLERGQKSKYARGWDLLNNE